MGMILRIASSRIVGQGDIVGRSGYFSLNLSANSVMRGRLDARRTLKSLVADLRFKWAAQDGETLVVITADHETGGLTLLGGDKDKGEIQCKFSTTDHSGVMVPVYAFGPGSEMFTGIYENTAIFDKIKKLLNL